MTTRLPTRCGFSLVELMVVVGIVGLLLAVLLPAVQASREAARRITCRSNLKQLGVALHNYHSARGAFPPGSHNGWSWIGSLLPYIEQGPLYATLDFDLDPFVPPNDEQTATLLPLLMCPSDPASDSIHVASTLAVEQSFAHTNYLGTLATRNRAHRGMFMLERGVRVRDVTDGTSNTLFVGERGVVVKPNVTYGWWAWGIDADTLLSSRPGLWLESTAPTSSPHYWWSHHTTGVHFLFVDGAVRYLPYSMDNAAFQAAASKNGGEWRPPPP